MTYAFIALAGASLSAFITIKDDYRFGAFVLTIASGVGAIACAMNHL